MVGVTIGTIRGRHGRAGIIGGATALFTAGANETVIRTMGRWSSDLHRLYVRCCFEQCRDWSAKLGSVDFTAAVEAFDEVDDY